MSSGGNRKKYKKRNEDFKHYLGNVSEGQGFADKRKKKAAYDYLKLLKKEKLNVAGKIDKGHGPLKFLQDQNRSKGKGKHVHSFTAAQKMAEEKQKAKQEKYEHYMKRQEEREAALAEYKSKKKKAHMKLCKKTRKGQPVMKHQMDVLLDKLEKQKKSS